MGVDGELRMRRDKGCSEILDMEWRETAGRK